MLPIEDPLGEIIQDLIKQGKYLDHDQVYLALATQLPLQEIRSRVKRDYGNKQMSISIIEKVQEKLGEEHVRLLVEPNLTTRINSFIEFCQRQDDKDQATPEELRNRFRDSCKQRTVYRAVAVKPSNVKNIIKNGFVANFLRGKKSDELLKDNQLAQRMRYTIESQVFCHDGYGHTDDSRLISVSAYPEMAQYAAFCQLKDRWHAMKKEGYQMMLFSLDVNSFYGLEYGSVLQRRIEGDGTWICGDTKVPYRDPGVEIFFQFRIPPELIVTDKIAEIDTSSIPHFQFESLK